MGSVRRTNAKFSCGHVRATWNTVRRVDRGGKRRPACRICRNTYMRKLMKKRRRLGVA